ncbi:MAG: prepilin-type N-terminal cleavage/methylation domain-containing protein [Patescibacteria group bacterium]
MGKMLQINRGFTIVELLIVIVVIGVLASIAVIAFNGVKTKTANTQTHSIVSTHAKTLRLYLVQNGSYPAGLTLRACFDGTASCWAGAVQADSDILMTALRQVSPSYPTQPAPANMTLSYGTEPDTTKGGNYTGWYIAYILQSSVTCPVISSGYFLNSAPNGSGTICRTAMPVQL